MSLSIIYNERTLQDMINRKIKSPEYISLLVASQKSGHAVYCFSNNFRKINDFDSRCLNDTFNYIFVVDICTKYRRVAWLKKFNNYGTLNILQTGLTAKTPFPLYTPHCHMILSKQKCCLLLTGVSTESKKNTSVLQRKRAF